MQSSISINSFRQQYFEVNSNLRLLAMLVSFLWQDFKSTNINSSGEGTKSTFLIFGLLNGGLSAYSDIKFKVAVLTDFLKGFKLSK